MSSNTLIAIVAASLVAFVCFIIIIAFVAWKCKSFDKKHGKKLLGKSVYDQPTILKRHPPTLMPARLNKTPQYLQDRSLVYTVQMAKQSNPKMDSPISKQQSKKNKQPKKVWPTSNSISTFSNSIVWRPKENKSGQKPQKYKEEEETQATVSDRQRKPHKGSIRHLPSANTCKF